jgi:hypothetical protein
LADSKIRDKPNVTTLTSVPARLDLLLLEQYSSGANTSDPSQNVYITKNVFVKDFVSQIFASPTITGTLTGAAANFSGTIKSGIYTVGTLPAGADGLRAFVTDALAPAFGATVAAGGAIHTPVIYSSGTSTWNVG